MMFCALMLMAATSVGQYLDELYLDSAIGGAKLSIAGEKFERGVSVRAASSIVMRLNGCVQSFSAKIGFDDTANSVTNRFSADRHGRLRFRVYVDDRIAYVSPDLDRRNSPKPVPVKVDLAGAKVMALEVENLGSYITYAFGYGDWADAKFELGEGGEVKLAGADDPLVEQWGILTPPERAAPRINGPTVWGVRPGNPVDYYIPIAGERPIEVSIKGNLPEGVRYDAKRNMVLGSAAKAGAYPLKVVAKNSAGEDERAFTLFVGDRISLTPQLGWNSWNIFSGRVSDADIRAVADQFVKLGLIDHGWMYVNIDDGWSRPHSYEVLGPVSGNRDSQGRIRTNAKFPDMKAMTDYIHSKGLRAGLYSSPGYATCGRREGSYGHEAIDARTWAEWGFDYVKYDWCGYKKIVRKNPKLEDFQAPYVLMGRELAKQKRDIVFSLCQYGMGEVGNWARDVGGNCWRATGDLKDEWNIVLLNAEKLATDKLRKCAGPGCWPDNDMMTIGHTAMFGKNGSALTRNEHYSHLALWTMNCSPMLLGCDLSKTDEFTISCLKNDALLAIHQDELGKPADGRIDESGIYAVWKRPLADGGWAVALVNRFPYTRQLTLDLVREGLPKRVRMRDVWRDQCLGVKEGSVRFSVPPHATVMLRMYSDCKDCR